MKRIFLTIILFALITKSFAQWKQTNGIAGGSITCFEEIGNTLFAGTSKGIFTSTDAGISWHRFQEMDPTNYITAFFKDGSNLYVGSAHGVYLINKPGNVWQNKSIGLYQSVVRDILVDGSIIMAALDYQGIFIAEVGIWQWKNTTANLPRAAYMSLEKHNNVVFAGINNYSGSIGAFTTVSHGYEWIPSFNGLSSYMIYSFAKIKQTLFAGSNGQGIYTTTDGSEWIQSNSGLRNLEVNGLLTVDTTIFAATDSGIYSSNNLGKSWNIVGLANEQVNSLFFSGNKLFAGLNSGRIGYFDSEKIWKYNYVINSSITKLAVADSILFAITKTEGLQKSSNHGNSWNLSQRNNFHSLLTVPGKIFTGSSASVSYSKDRGITWKENYIEMGKSGVDALAFHKNILFAGTSGSGISISKDSGVTWNTSNTGLTNLFINAFASLGNKMFAGTDRGFFVTENDGANWQPANGNLNVGPIITSMVVKDSGIFAGSTEGSVLNLKDLNSNWEYVNPTIVNPSTNCLAVCGSTVFAGIALNGVYYTKNNGADWNTLNNGLGNLNVLSLVCKDDTLYAGTDGDGVWKIPVNNEITGNVESKPNTTWDLYPNPASSITHCFKSLEYNNSGFAKAAIVEFYNICGKKVLQKDVSENNVEINLIGLGKGMYFVKIYEDQKSVTRKLIVE